jgi:pimeloyl-ACP methyl ester carboxylesterase
MIKNLLLLATLFLTKPAAAQPSMAQDTTLNNLVHPDGYKTCKIGELGQVKRTGHGKQCMIFIAGLGFSGDAYKDFERNYQDQFTIYMVTPAGFGATPAPPMPASGVPYAEGTFTNGIVTGVVNLIEKEKLTKPIIVAHFVTGTQAALNLALDYPDKVGKVIIIGGSPYRYYPGQKGGQYNDWENEIKYTPEQRSKMVEVYWAPKWFKTVTKKTWDDNMWTPDDYAADSVTGKKLFNISASVPLPVMIRYLIEWMAYDASPRYKEIKVPVLILMPDFKEEPPAKQYLKYFHQEGWRKALDSGNPLIQAATIPDTRLFMWYDHPQEVYSSIDSFLRQAKA